MSMSQSTELEKQLHEQLTQWLRIVVKCISRSGKWWRPKDEANYQHLHKKLLETLRSAPMPDIADLEAGQFGIGVTAAMLTKLIRPWSTLSSLQYTEELILQDLLEKCRAELKNQFGRNSASQYPDWSLRTVGFLVICQVVIAIVVAAMLRLSDAGLLTDMRVCFNHISYEVQGFAFPQLLACSVTAIIVAAFFLLRQTKQY